MKARHFYTWVLFGLDNREPKTHLDTCGVLKHIIKTSKSIQYLMAGSTETSLQTRDDQLLCMLKISVVALLCKFLFCKRRAEQDLQAGNYSNPDKMSQKHELTFQYLYFNNALKLVIFLVDNRSFVPPECTRSPKKSPQLRFTSIFCTDEDQAVFMCGAVKEQIFRHSVNSIIKHSGLIFFMSKAIFGQPELCFIRNGDQMLLLSL